MQTAIITVSLIAILMIGYIVYRFFLPARIATRFLRSRRMEAGLTSRKITLPTNETYAYLEGGSGSPLLLLHGFGSNKDIFIAVAKGLTPHYHVVCPDHIGFGESDRPANADYSPIAQAKRLRMLVETLGLTNIHIGGSSMGGHIAMTYASLFPDKTDSLMLISPGGIWSAPESELGVALREQGHNPLIVESTEDFANLSKFVMFKPPILPKFLLETLANQRIQNAELERTIFAAATKDSAEQRVKNLKTPTLILWGAVDRVINVGTGTILQKLIPGAKLVVFPETGHLPMLEAVDDTVNHYLVFRTSIENG